MLTKLASPINRITSTKFWYYIENILVVGLLFYCIKSLTDYDNVYYQTWKNEAAVKAILAFSAIVFIIRKVKLFNWQSLVATLIFGIIVLERMHFWADSEDILAVIRLQMTTEWLSLMIVIDMILYKNVNKPFKGVNYLLIFYVLMTFGMIWRRHDRLDPIVLIFPMFLLALVKFDEEKKNWFLRRFIDGWFISFIYVMIKSFTERPYEGYRYYGCFLNIGQFGIYMVCCFIVSILSIHYCKEKYGRRNIGYFASIIWLMATIYMLYIIDTRTIWAGVLFCIAYLFIYVRKNTSRKILVGRWIILLTTLLLMIGLVIISLKACEKMSLEWLNAHSTGIFAPIANNLIRLRWIVLSEEINPNKSFYTFINLITSYRLDIWKGYSDYFNFDGNSTLGFTLEEIDYWVYTAHNTFIQFLVEYGYLSFVEILGCILFTLGKKTNSFINKGKQSTDLFPALWLTSMLGVWLGESNTVFFPITFFGFMFVSLSIFDANDYSNSKDEFL